VGGGGGCGLGGGGTNTLAEAKGGYVKHRGLSPHGGRPCRSDGLATRREGQAAVEQVWKVIVVGAMSQGVSEKKNDRGRKSTHQRETKSYSRAPTELSEVKRAEAHKKAWSAPVKRRGNGRGECLTGKEAVSAGGKKKGDLRCRL